MKIYLHALSVIPSLFWKLFWNRKVHLRQASTPDKVILQSRRQSVWCWQQSLIGVTRTRTERSCTWRGKTVIQQRDIQDWSPKHHKLCGQSVCKTSEGNWHTAKSSVQFPNWTGLLPQRARGWEVNPTFGVVEEKWGETSKIFCTGQKIPLSATLQRPKWLSVQQGRQAEEPTFRRGVQQVLFPPL